VLNFMIHDDVHVVADGGERIFKMLLFGQFLVLDAQT
jgi:hypothetical protein